MHGLIKDVTVYVSEVWMCHGPIKERCDCLYEWDVEVSWTDQRKMWLSISVGCEGIMDRSKKGVTVYISGVWMCHGLYISGVWMCHGRTDQRWYFVYLSVVWSCECVMDRSTVWLCLCECGVEVWMSLGRTEQRCDYVYLSAVWRCEHCMY